MAAGDKSFFAELTPLFEASVKGEGAGGIHTESLMVACEALTNLFDKIGKPMKVVKDDMTGNIGKIRKIDVAEGEGSTNIADITEETESGRGSLMWLLRGLAFIDVLLANLIKDTAAELAPCARDAYNDTLSKHHGWVVRQLAGTLFGIAPYRADFMVDLAQGVEADVAFEDIKVFYQVFHSITKTIYKLYDDNGWDESLVNMD